MWPVPLAQPLRALAAFVVARFREGLDLPFFFLVADSLFLGCFCWEGKELIHFATVTASPVPFVFLVTTSLLLFCFIWEGKGLICFASVAASFLPVMNPTIVIMSVVGGRFFLLFLLWGRLG